MKALWRSGAAASVLAATCVGVQAQQGQVSVYGLMDTSVEVLTRVGASGDRLVRMPSWTGSYASRLGFRGEEDVGSGLRAVFTLEMGIAPDNGALNQGGRGFGRQSFVGLQGRWGTFTMGRQYSTMYWSLLDADIVGPNLYGIGSLDSYLSGARADNAIAYRGTFGAWTMGATYSFGRDAIGGGGLSCAGEQAGESKACRQWSLLAQYRASHWGMVLAVDEMRGGTGALGGLTHSGMKDRRSTVNGWMRFGATKLGGGLIMRHNDAAADAPRSRLWYLGAAYTLTPVWVLDGAAYRLDVRDSRNGANLYALRATYNLSKRTAAYATAGYIRNQGGLALSVSGGAAGGLPQAGGSQTGWAMGLRHAF